MKITLSDSDRELLRRCPFTLANHPTFRMTRQELADAKRVARLQAAGLVTGKVTQARIGDLVTMIVLRTPAGDAVLFGRSG